MFDWRHVVCLALVLLAGVSGAADDARSSARASVYAGAPVEHTKAPNGAIVNKAILDNADLVRHSGETTYKLLDGVYVMADTPYVSAFIEGPDGVLVWDTGFGKTDGAYYKGEIRKITRKPIKAVLYSSSHPVLGTSALIAGETGVKIIGRESLKGAAQGGRRGSCIRRSGPNPVGALLRSDRDDSAKAGRGCCLRFRARDQGERLPARRYAHHSGRAGDDDRRRAPAVLHAR